MKEFHIKKKAKPVSNDLNERIRWFSDSLGLISLRDKDNSCYRIFIEIVKSSKNNREMTSDEIAYKTGLTRGTIVHHLNKLSDYGFIVIEKNKYVLKEKRLSNVVDSLSDEINLIMKKVKDIAKEIDEEVYGKN